ncbi:GNAT family N-acetyltransferase [Dyadobacter flavalbus]|uniref:GNAT family N-acetyltransferase n=1 Tax=Dyadobacter flavalbus TaxID=2579942 RepID=UPI0035B5B59B
MGFPNENKAAEIGYIIDANEQCKGSATEALKTLSQWALQHIEVDPVIVQSAYDNIASIRILEKTIFNLS